MKNSAVQMQGQETMYKNRSYLDVIQNPYARSCFTKLRLYGTIDFDHVLESVCKFIKILPNIKY